MDPRPPGDAPDDGVTLLSVSLGIMWVAHALLKLLAFTLPGTEAFFTSVGLPGLLACPVFMVELLGGAALILGVHARQVSLALVPIMAVAVWVHFPNGWVHTSLNGGWEYPVFLIAVSAALWLLGDGALALQRSAWMAPVPRSQIAMVRGR